MAKRDRKQRNGLIYLDPDKLERQMLRRGLTKTSLADAADLSRNSILRASRGEGIFAKTAALIAGELGLEDVNELLPSGDSAVIEKASGSIAVNGEWEIDDYLGPWITASNSLQFRVCRLRHRYIEGRLGRGKWYDLLDPSTRVRSNLKEQLLRHPTICERIGRHPQIAENLSTTPGTTADAWWVVDRWVEATTLQSRLDQGPYPPADLPRLMREIGQGLAALHAGEVVFRELAPSRVLLTIEEERVVLTDFELAKLLSGAPTVSADWPDDPYRAPEVEDGLAGVSSDLYSWARILLQAATGELPAKGCEAEALSRANLPKSVWRIATDCLSPNPADRPKDVAAIFRAIKRWRA